jgi:hypothetical protein
MQMSHLSPKPNLFLPNPKTLETIPKIADSQEKSLGRSFIVCSLPRETTQTPSQRAAKMKISCR